MCKASEHTGNAVLCRDARNTWWRSRPRPAAPLLQERLRTSMFEWLLRAKVPCQNLTTLYRSHDSISRLVSKVLTAAAPSVVDGSQLPRAAVDPGVALPSAAQASASAR